MDPNDPFGFDCSALSKLLGSLGEGYEPYAKAVLDKGLFGQLLLDYVNDVETFLLKLEKIGVTEVGDLT